jgi:hypothetical protein
VSHPGPRSDSYVGDSEDGHLKADQGINESEGHVLGISVNPDWSMSAASLHDKDGRLTPLDSVPGHEERDASALPEGEEQDAFDA